MLSHAAVFAMSDRGPIVNVSSIAGFIALAPTPQPILGSRSFAESLTDEFASAYIIVSALCQGCTRSEFHQCTATKSQDIINCMWLQNDSLVRDYFRGCRK